MKSKDQQPATDDRSKKVVLLRDLAPRTKVKGGAGKVPFGAQPPKDGRPARAPRKGSF